jgi:hypothetical protein
MVTFISTGTIITNPQSESTALGEWWMIVNACPELGRYYNRLLKFAMRARPNFVLQVPSWGYHISVLRGEVLTTTEAIERYAAINGTEVEFQYEHEILSNGRYFWLAVHSERMLDIRESLGLPRMPYFNFHLTIGVNPLIKEPNNDRGENQVRSVE